MKSDQRRIGYVRFNGDVMYSPSDYAWLFKDAVVWRVDEDMHAFMVTYYLFHPDFDLLPQGAIMPEYELVVRKDEVIWKPKQ